MIVERFVLTPFQQNTRIVACGETGKTICIDPGEDSPALASFVRSKGFDLQAITLTHGHLDHVGGTAGLSREFPDAEIILHKDDEDLYYGLPQQPLFMGIQPDQMAALGFDYEDPPALSRNWADGEVYEVGRLRFNVRHCPGHTKGHVVLAEETQKAVFVGDCLFAGSIGRTDLPGGNYEQLMDSINGNIIALGDDFTVYSGHGPETTVGQERISNPFLNGTYQLSKGKYFLRRHMRRFFSLIGLAALLTGQVMAHGDDSHFENRQDVQVKTTKVNGNVYMLQGRGGNVGALVGPDGILIVDDDYKAVSTKLAAALKELGSDKPRFVFNTHWHGDHTEGNELFGKDSIILAHVNVRKRLLDPPVIFGQKTAPYAAFALPIVTYTESMTLNINGEEVRAVHFPNGHTDGDSVIFFKNANVVHLGDDFFVGRFPFIDLDSGGSVQGMINNVAALIRQIPADAKLIPGHGPLATLDDLKAYHQTLVETSNLIQAEMQKGKSVDEIKKAGLPEKYKEWGSGFIKNDFWIDIVYRSYSKK